MNSQFSDVRFSSVALAKGRKLATQLYRHVHKLQDLTSLTNGVVERILLRAEHDLIPQLNRQGGEVRRMALLSG